MERTRLRTAVTSRVSWSPEPSISCRTCNENMNTLLRLLCWNKAGNRAKYDQEVFHLSTSWQQQTVTYLLTINITFSSSLEVPLVEFTHLLFTRMPGGSHRMLLRSLLLCLCDDFQALINSLVCWFCRGDLGLFLFQIVYCLVFRIWLGRVFKTRILPKREQEKKLYFNTNQAYRVKFTPVPHYSSAGGFH